MDADAGVATVTWLLGGGVLLLITAGLSVALLLHLRRRQAIFQQRVGLLATRPSSSRSSSITSPR